MSFIVKTKAIVGAVTLTLCCIGLLYPSIAETAVFQVEEESWGPGDLVFSVNNDYTDIREFAVGNNTAYDAGYWDNLGSPTQYLTDGSIATKSGGHWSVQNEAVGGGVRYLPWMDDAVNFSGYTKAFLFTSWGDGDVGYDGFLETGFTNGYKGDAESGDSPFAGFSVTEGIIMGDTEAVPLPSAIWLLGSGLIGLVGFRRKLKKS